MKDLIIIGARGFGRESYYGFAESPKYGVEYIIKGFLDSKSDALDGYQGYAPIIGAPEDYTPRLDDVFFCAMGDVKWRKYYAEMLLAKGAVFISHISEKSIIGRNTEVGQGCFIDYNVNISCDIKVDDFTFIFGPTVIGHDTQIGKYCHLGSFSFMGGFSKLEDGVTLHPGAQVLPHLTVQKNAIVGAGSVVIRRVKEATTVMGVPAKKIDY